LWKARYERQAIVGDEKLDLDSYDAARVFFTRCDTQVPIYYFDSLPKIEWNPPAVRA